MRKKLLVLNSFLSFPTKVNLKKNVLKKKTIKLSLCFMTFFIILISIFYFPTCIKKIQGCLRC